MKMENDYQAFVNNVNAQWFLIKNMYVNIQLCIRMLEPFYASHMFVNTEHSDFKPMSNNS